MYLVITNICNTTIKIIYSWPLAYTIYTETDESNNWSDIDSWTWKEDFDDPDKDSCTENWIQSCIVVSSPQAEIFVIAHKDRYVVFTCNFIALQFLVDFSFIPTNQLFYLIFS